MGSRRRLLAAAPALLTATAGCLSTEGAPDVAVTNETDERVVARLTVEPESGGTRALRRTVELAPSGDDGDSVTVADPVTEDGVPHVLEVVVKGGPEGSGTFTDDGNGPFSTGTGGVRARVTADGVTVRPA